MDLLHSLDVSASGLSAQRARMAVIAENLANAETTTTSTGGPYRRKTAVLQAVDGHVFPAMLQQAGDRPGAVRVTQVAETSDLPRRVHEPGHPQADADGFVNYPNVTPLTEMVDMLATTRAYEANATAFQAAKAMGTKLLELLR